MEIERVTSARAVDPAMAAWAAAVEALSSETAATDQAAPAAGDPLSAQSEAITSPTRSDTVQVQAGLDPSRPVGEPARPGVDTDAGHEANTVQSNWRVPTQATEPPRGAGQDAAHRTIPATPGGRAVPDALLVAATLCGLRAEPSNLWPLPHPTLPKGAPHSAAVQRREEPPSQREAHRDPPAPGPEEDAGPAPPDRQGRRDNAGPDLVFDAAADGAWCDDLSAALRLLLRQASPPQALMTAAEQWRRGRCVVLACPQGPDPVGLAWAFVLWPRPGAPAQDLPDLFGLRVSARLHWQALPPPSRWCHGRALKEHHPRHGRQLVASRFDPTRPDLPVPCEVQLGPVLARPLRRCEVRVQIQAAQRFWAALGRQWSVQVVVGARPLLAVLGVPAEAQTC